MAFLVAFLRGIESLFLWVVLHPMVVIAKEAIVLALDFLLTALRTILLSWRFFLDIMLWGLVSFYSPTFSMLGLILLLWLR